MIYDLSLPELEKALGALGEPRFRARQVWRGLYVNLYSSVSEFPNLPHALKPRLAEALKFGGLEPVRHADSADGKTRKMLFRLHDGQLIESVLMRYDPDTFTGRGRRTVCVSTQAGCAMGCVFCATGQMGFKRNLSIGEIVGQVLYFAGQLKKEESTLTNVVFMGMGEPFHNYENTMAAIDRLNDPEAFGFGARRMTVSTVGLVPQIRRYADEGRQANLAVSLHASDDATRARMMPVNKRYQIDEVIEACRYYVSKTNRRVTFEWALIDGVNDTPEAARALTKRLRGLLCHVNCIPLNPTAAYSGRASGSERAERFRRTVEAGGIPCTIRLRRGVEIAAGCGQLAVDVVNV